MECINLITTVGRQIFSGSAPIILYHSCVYKNFTASAVCGFVENTTQTKKQNTKFD